MIDLEELLKEYASDKDSFKLSNFILENKKTVVLHCFNEGITDWKILRQEISAEFKTFQEGTDKACHNDRNAVDWVQLSNQIKMHEAFKNIAQAESSRAIEASNNWAIDIKDTFANDNSQYISQLVLNDNIEKWRESARHETKLAKQDLLYYNVLDLIDPNTKNGAHEVLGNYFKAEKERWIDKYDKNKEIKNTCRSILKLKNNNKASLKERVKDAKNMVKSIPNEDPARAVKKRIVKICKVYVDFEKEGFHLHEKNANEGTYLMLFMRPILLQVMKPIPSIYFNWLESSLACKKDLENGVLAHQGESASTAKIDGILIDREFEVEVGIIEVSGPSWKVDTTHFIEDRIKIAKNLKTMYKYIMALRDDPYIVIRRAFKVYGLHLYLNKLYVYSLSRPSQSAYVFQQEYTISFPHSKHVVNVLPPLVSDLWVIQDLFIAQHNQLEEFLSYAEVSAQSSQSSVQSEVYTSPRKKQRTTQVL